MVFSSITFLIAFLPAVLLFYYSFFKWEKKNYILLLFSLLFYTWGEPKYIGLMLGSILVNFFSGRYITRPEIPLKKRRRVLITTIVLNLLGLYIFKYFGFTTNLVNELVTKMGMEPLPVFEWILPVGISFYTFHAISYLVDVYKQPEKVQKDLLDMALFITFFPQLVAGPIMRYDDISYQIVQRKHSWELFALGIERFIVGLAKKVLLANFFAEVADGIYALPFEEVSGFYYWIAVFSYTLQIYYDFSGYSDMAIGLGRMFGFNLMENFNYPYAAKSMTDFWRRWHISLSSWFRTYVYIPLGGSKSGLKKTVINLGIVFFITGLWHGAAISFVVWGMGHGLLVIFEKLAAHYFLLEENKFRTLLSRIYTLTCVVLLWIFFRIPIAESLRVIAKLFSWNADMNSPKISSTLYLLVDTRFYIWFSIALIFVFPWWRKVAKFNSCEHSFVMTSLKYIVILILFLLCMGSLANNVYNPFIYFRF